MVKKRGLYVLFILVAILSSFPFVNAQEDQEQSLIKVMNIYSRDYTDEISDTISSLDNAQKIVSNFIGSNERINLYIDQLVGPDQVNNVILENNVIIEISKGEIEDNTLNIYVDELTIERIWFSDNPTEEFLSAYKKGKIKISGNTFSSKIKLGVGKVLFSVGDIFRGMLGGKKEAPKISEMLEKIKEKNPSKEKLIELIDLLEKEAEKKGEVALSDDNPITKEIEKTVDELIKKNKEDIAKADEEEMKKIIDEKIELSEFMLSGFVSRDWDEIQNLFNLWLERMIELNQDKIENAKTEEELSSLLKEKADLWEFSLSGLVDEKYEGQILGLMGKIVGKILNLNEDKIENAKTEEELSSLLKEKEGLKTVACALINDDDLCKRLEDQISQIKDKLQ